MVRMGMKRGEKKEGLFRGSARRSFFAVSNGPILPLGNVFLLGLFFSLNITSHPQSLGHGDIDAGAGGMAVGVHTTQFAIREHDPQPSETFYRSCAWPDSSRYADHKATYEYHFMNVVVPDAVSANSEMRSSP